MPSILTSFLSRSSLLDLISAIWPHFRPMSRISDFSPFWTVFSSLIGSRTRTFVVFDLLFSGLLWFYPSQYDFSLMDERLKYVDWGMESVYPSTRSEKVMMVCRPGWTGHFWLPPFQIPLIIIILNSCPVPKLKPRPALDLRTQTSLS
jgi:hypothetical protein